jgi:hypothetical protein
MIKVGNILLDPNDISSVHQDLKAPVLDNNRRGVQVIQIIYKNGVVKNFTSAEIGMSCSDFIDKVLEETKKSEDSHILKLMAAVKSLSNE